MRLSFRSVVCHYIFSHGSNRLKKIPSRWAGSTYISRNSGADEKGQIVWPGQELVLLPPPLHDETHVETQDERHRYGFAGVAEIIADFLEDSAKHGEHLLNAITRKEDILVGLAKRLIRYERTQNYQTKILVN